MGPHALRVLGLATAVGTSVGAAARFAPNGAVWLAILLSLSAAWVALAQQTLP
jgi:hypothetical protein